MTSPIADDEFQEMRAHVDAAVDDAMRSVVLTERLAQIIDEVRQEENRPHDPGE